MNVCLSSTPITREHEQAGTRLQANGDCEFCANTPNVANRCFWEALFYFKF